MCRLCRFSRFPNSCHINIRFSMETEKNKMLSFLDVEILCQQGKFTTTVYQKPTFSGIYINFQWFLPSIHKFRMIYNLVYRCFCICSNWTQFHKKLTFLKGIFCKNGYPKLFLKNGQGQLFLKVFKKNRSCWIKRMLLVFPYLREIFLQTRFKLQQTLKDVSKMSKGQTRLFIIFSATLTPPSCFKKN